MYFRYFWVHDVLFKVVSFMYMESYKIQSKAPNLQISPNLQPSYDPKGESQQNSTQPTHRGLCYSTGQNSEFKGSISPLFPHIQRGQVR